MKAAGRENSEDAQSVQREVETDANQSITATFANFSVGNCLFVRKKNTHVGYLKSLQYQGCDALCEIYFEIRQRSDCFLQDYPKVIILNILDEYIYIFITLSKLPALLDLHYILH